MMKWDGFEGTRVIENLGHEGTPGIGDMERSELLVMRWRHEHPWFMNSVRGKAYRRAAKEKHGMGRAASIILRCETPKQNYISMEKSQKRWYSEVIGRAGVGEGEVLNVPFGAGEEDQEMSVEAATSIELVWQGQGGSFKTAKPSPESKLWICGGACGCSPVPVLGGLRTVKTPWKCPWR